MTSIHEKQLKEQNQEVKNEHDTRFIEGEEHLHFDGNVYEDQMETTCKSTTFATITTMDTRRSKASKSQTEIVAT